MWYVVNTADGKRCPITEEGLTIGREGCSLLTPATDSQVSRQHATVRLRGEAVEVQDLGSTNGTYIDQQRIGQVASWGLGQMLRCGQTTFQLVGDYSSVQSEQAKILTVNATEAAPEAYMNRSPVSPPHEISTPASSPQSPLSPPADNRQGHSTEAAAQLPATNSEASTLGIVVGIILLIIGIVGWQHYQPQMNIINSMFGQFAIELGGDSAFQEVAHVKMLYTGSIVLACVGGILVMASAIRLAVARK